MPELLDEFLRKPIGPTLPKRPKFETKTVALGPNPREAVTEIALDGATGAEQYLISQGLDPREWKLKSVWGGPGKTNYSFDRVATVSGASLSDAELDRVLDYRPSLKVPENGSQGVLGPPKTYIVGLGDMQFGKTEGDGLAGTLERATSAIDKAVERFDWYASRFDIERVCVAWLGDHIEGFESQGGSNSWRTGVPLTEQLRVTRRLMIYAMQRFLTLGLPVSMVAVPGNHGEATRFGAHGITRYDDSHDTECLISVMEAAEMNPDVYGNVSFFVPDNDELSVALELSGTRVVFTHGHKMKPRNYHAWVKGQAYNRTSVFADCDLVMMGHYHHEYVESDGNRMIIQVPTLEAESKWWYHVTGTEAVRGILVGVTGQSRTDQFEYVR